MLNNVNIGLISACAVLRSVAQCRCATLRQYCRRSTCAVCAVRRSADAVPAQCPSQCRRRDCTVLTNNIKFYHRIFPLRDPLDAVLAQCAQFAAVPTQCLRSVLPYAAQGKTQYCAVLNNQRDRGLNNALHSQKKYSHQYSTALGTCYNNLDRSKRSN
jgi:hypothetical protein